MKRALFLLLALVLLAVPAEGSAQLLQPAWPFPGKGFRLFPSAPEPAKALEDVYVVPSRPGQNRVPYWDWDWQVYEFNTERGGGGVRLFFYDRARSAAEYAVTMIRTEYDRLSDRFHYLPRSTIPFVFYASTSEFQATNVFFISEGTLGATDPRDLRMAMPFFGNVDMFRRVSTHEMAHQFTIQKVRDASAAAKVGNTLMLMPLWFIEGLAEYFTFDGIDPEGDYILRDLVTNPNPMKGYAVPDFFNDRAGGFIGIYKLGQARVTFIAEQYGHDKVVELLERSPLLAGAFPRGAPGAPPSHRPEGAPGQVPPPTPVPNAPEEPGQTEPDGEGDGQHGKAGGQEGNGHPEATAAAPRSGEGETGSSEAGAAQNAPSEAAGDTAEAAETAVAGAGPSGDSAKAEQSAPTAPTAPGAEPAEEAAAQGYPRSFPEFVARVVGDSPEQIDAKYQDWLKRRYFREYLDTRQTLWKFKRFPGLKGEPDSVSVSDDGHVFLYRTVERETGLSSLHVQDVRNPGSHEVIAKDQRPSLESLHPVDRRVTTIRGGRLAFAGRTGKHDSLFARTYEQVKRKGRHELRLGSEERFDLGEILEVYDPALSPDGKRVAFAGVDPSGFRDLYMLELEGPRKGAIDRLTDDVWSESDLYWDGGRLLFVSDRSESRQPNIYALEVATRKTTRLTATDAEDRHPVPALGGVVFRSMRAGKPDLYLLRDGELQRLTDTPSAMLLGLPASDGGLWALSFHSGEYGIYRINPDELLKEKIEPKQAGVGGTGVAPGGYARSPIPSSAPAYRPGNPSNWRFEASAGAMVGSATIGAAGLAITDLLRDHVVLVNLAIYGSLKLTDALVFYINQSRRPELGFGLFHTFEPRRDKTFGETVNYYLERQFGVAGLLRYPFDRFRRVEGTLELRGIDRFGFTDYTGVLGARWSQLNAGVEPEIVATVAYGYDTMRLHALAGPVEGSSLLASLSAGYLPIRQFSYGRANVDLQHRLRVYGRTNLLFRGAAGATTGGRFSPQFFLFSVGNMEGFPFGDDRLLGDHFYVANLRLTLPIDQLVYIPLFTGIYAVAGFDFGATFDKPELAWDSRSLSGVLGTDIALGALVLQLHFGKLIDIGGLVRSRPWAFNLNLRYLYL